MSSFIKDGYYCIDDYFGSHNYGYVKMTEDEKMVYDKAGIGAWFLLDFTTLELRGGNREVLKSPLTK